LSLSRPARVRGYTLVELLAVVAIIGFLAMMGFGELNKVTRREALASASTDLTVLLQQAPVFMRQRDAVAFVRIGAVQTDGFYRGRSGRPYRDVTIHADTCDDAGVANSPNGRFNNCDLVVQTARLQLFEVVLTTTATDDSELQSKIEQLNWTESPSGSDQWVIGVNFRGQTIGPAGNALGRAAVLSLTHHDMVEVGGSKAGLKPMVVFETHVDAVWEPSVRRLVEGKTY
jgi:prepilin-type N-terminal cleavage/methylation domain-containing protein